MADAIWDAVEARLPPAGTEPGTLRAGHGCGDDIPEADRLRGRAASARDDERCSARAQAEARVPRRLSRAAGFPTPGSSAGRRASARRPSPIARRASCSPIPIRAPPRCSRRRPGRRPPTHPARARRSRRSRHADLFVLRRQWNAEKKSHADGHPGRPRPQGDQLLRDHGRPRAAGASASSTAPRISTVNGANALLKIVEEPPPRSLFLIVSPHAGPPAADHPLALPDAGASGRCRAADVVRARRRPSRAGGVERRDAASARRELADGSVRGALQDARRGHARHRRAHPRDAGRACPRSTGRTSTPRRDAGRQGQRRGLRDRPRDDLRLALASAPHAHGRRGRGAALHPLRRYGTRSRARSGRRTATISTAGRSF